MAISDTLFEAVEEIRRQQAEFPFLYDRLKPELDRLVAQMDSMRAMLDMPPGFTPKNRN